MALLDNGGSVRTSDRLPNCKPKAGQVCLQSPTSTVCANAERLTLPFEPIDVAKLQRFAGKPLSHPLPPMSLLPLNTGRTGAVAVIAPFPAALATCIHASNRPLALALPAPQAAPAIAVAAAIQAAACAAAVEGSVCSNIVQLMVVLQLPRKGRSASKGTDPAA
jgi:hypothetical protein